jgi:hypothetical protein
MSFHSKHMRFSLRSQITFKNIKITWVRTDIPRNLYYGKLNMGRSCPIIKNKAV